MKNKTNNIIKSIMLFICIAFSATQTASAQNGNLKLSQIIDMVACSTLNSFDIKVRKLGFTYEGVDDKIKYVYVKTIVGNGYDYFIRLYYHDNGNNEQLVVFSTSSSVSLNYCSEIKTQAKNLDFVEVEDNSEPVKSVTTSLFTNETYKLEIHDMKRNGRSNSYIIGVCYLSPNTKASNSDIESIDIGDQTWMKKNLNTDRFRNGDRIPQARSAEEWKAAKENKTPAWCYVEYDEDNNNKFGKMYNWYCVDDERGLAPAGWHVPSLAEARVLINELGGEKTASHALRSQTGWRDNANSTNTSGFTAYGSGKNWVDGSMLEKNFSAYFATTTKNEPDSEGKFQVNYFLIQQTSGTVFNNHSIFPGCGISVRCVKD